MAQLSIRSLSIVFLMIASSSLMMALPSVEANSNSSSPTAFLPDWTEVIDYDNILYHNSYAYYEAPYGYDDSGNFYVAFVEDYAQSVHPNAISSTRGIHILKFDSNGTHEWSKVIVSNNYCGSYNDYYCKLHGLFITGEDSFYVAIGTRNSNSFSFGSITKSVGSYGMITAYHSPSGWSYADVNALSQQSISSVTFQFLNEAKEYISILETGTSNGIISYDISAFSPTGGKWTRTYERNSNVGILHADVSNNETHLFTMAYSYVKYDSQTIDCPSGSQDDYCYIWISIDSSGVKNHTLAVKYASVYTNQFSVNNNQAYIFADTYDIVRGNHGQSNFSSNIVDNGAQSAYFTSLDTSGNWVFTKQIIQWPDIDDEYLVYTAGEGISEIEHHDNHAIIKLTSLIDVSYDNENFEIENSQTSPHDVMTLYIKTDQTGTYLGNVTILTDDLDYISKSIWSELGYLTQLVVSDSTVKLPNGSLIQPGLAFVSYETMEVVDYEVYSLNEAASYPLAIHPEGHLMTYNVDDQSTQFLLFAVDEDADNIGSGDNCPDVYNPSQSDYDDDLEGDACDSDDDNDGVLDYADLCPLGDKDWSSDYLTDHDTDGCRDSIEEDLDDDNDGIADEQDDCPKGLTGASGDTDADGCKDTEDSDDDDDGVNDGSDLCSPGVLGWISGSITDHDGDGCRDSDEDMDDDNDGVLDSMDSCEKGVIGWPANSNTDFDNDGCQDGFEDEDDDNDMVANFDDECPKSIGTVDSKGCTAEQNLASGDNNGGSGDSNSGETVIYYVCQEGSTVVTSLSDCPQSTNQTSGNNNSVTEFYFVCPGGTEIVNDMADCPDDLPSTNQNTTVIFDPSMNNTDDYTICPDGKYIAVKGTICPTNNQEQTDGSSQSSNEDSGGVSEMLILFFAGGSFLIATAAVLIVLIRRPSGISSSSNLFDSTEQIFKQQPALPASQGNRPPNNLSGNATDGFEWLEWPKGSGTHWYREEGSYSEWVAYQE